MANKLSNKDHSFIHVDYGSDDELGQSRNTVQIEARLSFSIRKRDGCYIATSREMRLKDMGETPREAFDNLVDMIIALLSDAIGLGELDFVLEERGFVMLDLGNRHEFSLQSEGAELPLCFKATAELGSRIQTAKLAWVG
jgi:hypothetical protein